MNQNSILSDLFPQLKAEWQINLDKTYDPETLYDYIDGGAELYISYNFKNVISRRYINNNGEEITIEIFDMQQAENAYGVFTQQREEESTEILQECQIITGSIIFWCDKYFISLMNNKETELVKETMLAFAKEISNKIEVTTSKPKIVSELPQQHLVKESVRFFKHYIWLNTYNYISTENIFNIDSQNRAVIAKYNNTDPKPIFLVISYKSPSDCSQVWNNLSLLYKYKSKKLLEVQKVKGEPYYLALKKEDTFIKAVYQTTSKHMATELINS